MTQDIPNVQDLLNNIDKAHNSMKKFLQNERSKLCFEEKEVNNLKQEEVNTSEAEQQNNQELLSVTNQSLNLIVVENETDTNIQKEKYEASTDSNNEESEYYQEYDNFNRKYNNINLFDKLEKYGYKVNPPWLYQEQKNGLKKISNFIPFIKEKKIYTNGIDEEIKYVLSGYNFEDFSELHDIEISKNELNMFNFIVGSSWDKEAIILGSNNIKLREVCQILSKDTMKTTLIYKNTGFERINNNLVYLYHNGVIGRQENIKTDLSEGGLQQYCFTDKQFDTKDALQTSFDILKVANEKVSIPLLAYTYITPLVSLLREENIFCDFLLMLIGGTNTGKSSTAALANSHFGTFKRNSFNTSLNDSISKIEKQSFILKDSIFVLDDLNPEHNSKKIETTDRVLAMLGDRQARGRVSTNIKMRKTYNSRGTAILTGEFVPPLARSRLSRAIILNFDKSTVNVSKLVEVQSNIDKLAYTMKIYIQFIIDNEKTIIEESVNVIEKLQNLQFPNSSHILGRTKEARNILYLGFHLFLMFMLSNNIITMEEKQQLEVQAEQVLNEIMLDQTKIVEETNPIVMFYNALETLINTNKISLVDYKTGHSTGSGSKIGYIDREKDRLYLYADAIYREVFAFYKKINVEFSLDKLTLMKTLQQEGLLHTLQSDPSRKEIVKTNPITKEKERVIDIARKIERDDF